MKQMRLSRTSSFNHQKSKMINQKIKQRLVLRQDSPTHLKIINQQILCSQAQQGLICAQQKQNQVPVIIPKVRTRSIRRNSLKFLQKEKVVISHTNNNFFDSRSLQKFSEASYKNNSPAKKEQRRVKEILSYQKMPAFQELFQKFLRQKIIKFQKNSNIIQLSYQNLKNLLQQFLTVIKQVQKKIDKILEQKQSLFSLLSQVFPNNLSCLKGNQQQSQIIKLRRQIKTYQRVVKLYRFQGRQEITNFELKLNAYRPSCQRDLLDKISKLNKASKLIQHENEFLREKLKSIKLSGQKVNCKEIQQQLQRTKQYKKQILQQSQTINSLNRQVQEKQARLVKLQMVELRYQQEINRANILQQQVRTLNKVKQSGQWLAQTLANDINDLHNKIQQNEKRISELNSQVQKKQKLQQQIKQMSSIISGKNQQIQRIIEQKHSMQLNFARITNYERAIKSDITQQQKEIAKILDRLKTTLANNKKGEQQKILFISRLIEKLVEAYQTRITEMASEVSNYKKQSSFLQKDCMRLCQRQERIVHNSQKCYIFIKQFIKNSQRTVEKAKEVIQEPNSIKIYLVALQQQLDQVKQKTKVMPLLMGIANGLQKYE